MEKLMLVLQDALDQQEMQLKYALSSIKRANKHTYPIYEKAIENLKTTISELKIAIEIFNNIFTSAHSPDNINVKEIIKKYCDKYVNSTKSIEQDFIDCVSESIDLAINACVNSIDTGFNHLDKGILDNGEQRYIVKKSDILKIKNHIIKQ